MTASSGSLANVSQTAIVPAGAVIANGARIGPGAILTDFVTIEAEVGIEAGVVFAGAGPERTIVRSGTNIRAGAVVAAGVELGRGSEIGPGSVVLNSVPPNAIVQGNPAQIVGYTLGAAAGLTDPALRTEGGLLGSSSAPSVAPLGVGVAALYRMRRVVDLRGALTVGEIEKDVPFVPRRYFIVFDVPSRELRGEHAHKECHQFLICVHGACRILLDDGQKRREVTLDRPDLGVYMPPMLWGTQYQYTPDAVLIVFASHPYDPADYIRTYDEFLTTVRVTR